MNAEAGSEPEAPKKRGRIPQSAWPEILERYRAGATLSAIAREFSCTPSAISYIVRKAEAAGIEAAPNENKEDESEVQAAPAPVEPPVEANPQPEEKATESTPSAPPDPAPVPVAEKPARRVLTAAMLTDPQAEAAPAPQAPPAPPAAQPQAQRAGGRPEPTPPVDEVEGRLRETARTCLATYRTWRQTPGEQSIQSLADAVHELRKALARIEIDMSASRREEQAVRPIPIPTHRAARRTF